MSVCLMGADKERSNCLKKDTRQYTSKSGASLKTNIFDVVGNQKNAVQNTHAKKQNPNQLKNKSYDNTVNHYELFSVFFVYWFCIWKPARLKLPLEELIWI